MIINKESRKEILDNLFHKREEKYLKKLNYTDDEIKSTIQKSVDYDINEYEGKSLGNTKEYLKEFVSEKYYNEGGLDFDNESDEILKFLYNEKSLFLSLLKKEDYDNIEIIFGIKMFNNRIFILFLTKDGGITEISSSQHPEMEYFINLNRSQKLKEILNDND